METIYYSLDAKRLTVCGEAAGRRASGGQETVCYAFVPRPRRPVMPAGGKVVDCPAGGGARPAPAGPAAAHAGADRGSGGHWRGGCAAGGGGVALFRGIEPKNCPGAALRTGAILCRGKNMQKAIDKLS